MAEKIDLFRQLKASEYVTPKKPVRVSVGKAAYLTIDGQGAPGGEEFTKNVGALYGVAYTVKMTRKYSGEQDYVVGKLEAQWWGDGDSGDFGSLPPEEWRWKLLMRVPDFVGGDELKKAVTVLLEKGKEPEVEQVELENMTEGECVQMLYVGPYDKESETIEQMRAFAETEGMEFSGRHHEIYLSDPRRVPPERLKTILRMPVIESGESTPV